MFSLEDWILNFISSYGYLGVFFLIMLENVFPPIPSEVILTFSGFATGSTQMTVTGVVFASTAGSLVGALILYWIGSLLDVERLEKIVDRYGKILQLKRADIYKADSWFDKYGIWTVLFCRLIPLIRSLISIPAGMSNMKLWLFILFTTIGSLVWNTILVNVGASVGNNWHTIVEKMDTFSNVIYVLLVIAFLLVVWFYLRLRQKRKRENTL